MMVAPVRMVCTVYSAPCKQDNNNSTRSRYCGIGREEFSQVLMLFRNILAHFDNFKQDNNNITRSRCCGIGRE